MSRRSRLLIIGTGHAGYTLAREWRKADPDSPLMLITRDGGVCYYKPDISKAFAVNKDAAALVKYTAAEMSQQLNAAVLAGTEVSRIAPNEHLVHTSAGAFTYDKLVLAVGAQPIHIPISGSGAQGVLAVNSLGDYADFRSRLFPRCRVLLIGAGLIGCEFANDLAAANFRVTAVDQAPWPLPKFLPEPCARALQAALQEVGVTFHLGATVVEVARASGESVRATLSDGRRLDADVVLSAVGLRPDLALAKDAGIICNQGIIVDECLQTSAPDVYALGDCIEIDGCLLPFILPIAHGARALAKTLAHNPHPVRFPPMPVIVKTPACQTVVCPPPTAHGRWSVRGANRDLEAVFCDSAGATRGFALTGSATSRRGELLTKLLPVESKSDRYAATPA